MCRRCKLKSLMDPDSVQVRDHLLLRGFMDGYRWQGDHHVEDVVHDDEEDQDEGHDHEDEDAGADDDGGWVQDPHIQELLLKQTDNARAAAREKAKMDQLA